MATTTHQWAARERVPTNGHSSNSKGDSNSTGNRRRGAHLVVLREGRCAWVAASGCGAGGPATGALAQRRLSVVRACLAGLAQVCSGCMELHTRLRSPRRAISRNHGCSP